eukprot:136111_1
MSSSDTQQLIGCLKMQISSKNQLINLLQIKCNDSAMLHSKQTIKALEKYTAAQDDFVNCLETIIEGKDDEYVPNEDKNWNDGQLSQYSQFVTCSQTQKE